MKTLAKFFAGLFFFGSVLTTFAQENDDMYFRAKDRAKLRASRASSYTVAPEEKKEASTTERTPSAERNVNPEYISRANNRTTDDEAAYFTGGYQYKNNSNQYSQWNNNFNSWYSNPWYSSAWYGPSISSWRSPYYGYYDAYSSPWYDPYWSYRGWSGSFSYYWGNSWDYGWGGNYSYWNRPYCGNYSFYGSSWSYAPWWGYGGSYYGSSYAWNQYTNFYYSPNTIINNNSNYSGRDVSSGKRPSRGGYVSPNPSSGNYPNQGTSSVAPVSRGRDTGGRVAPPTNNTPSRSTEYYNSNRRASQDAPARNSSGGYSRSSGNSWTGGDNNSGGSYRPSGRASSYSGGETRSHTYSGGETRSHSTGGGGGSSSSGGGGDSNGRSRGRD